MGRQVRFYMLPDDEKRFLQFALSGGDVSIVSDGFTTKPKPKLIDPKQVNSKYILAKRNFDQSTLLLWKNDHPFISNAFGKIGPGRYFIYPSDAPVIEFWRSKISAKANNKLLQGRIWADMYALRGDQVVYKGDDFRSWYDRIARWIRRNFRRVEGEDGYFGPEALKWYRKTGKIVR